MSKQTDALIKELRSFGLTYPGAYTRSPWPGHLDLVVKEKTFAFLSVEGEPFGISCKLPHSGVIALMVPNAKPTPYGLGKSGWVSLKMPDGKGAAGALPPIDMLKAWIDESYRAQAPKKLAASLTAGAPAAAKPVTKPAPKPAKRTIATKPATRRATKR